MRTLIRNYIDQHRYQDLMEYLKDSYSSLRVSSLDDVILWQGGNPKNFKGKKAKYDEVLRIVEWMCDEMQAFNQMENI